MLATKTVDYCLPRRHIKDAFDQYMDTGSTDRLVALSDQAKRLFADVDNSGEGGELLLFLLVESVLNAPQIISKMQLKTNTKMYIHGADGVHALALPGGKVALYWGESKLHASMSSAVSESFESITPFLLDEGGVNASRQDLWLVRNHLDMGAEEVTMELLRYFDNSDPRSLDLELRAVCLVGFDLREYPWPFEADGSTICSTVSAAMQRWHQSIVRRISEKSITGFEIEVFCVPFPDVDEFRKAIRQNVMVPK